LQGKYGEAVARNRDALRFQPDYYEAHCNLGSALQALGKHDEAVSEFREAARLQPENAQAHYNLGNILRSLGRRGEAAAAYREAIRARPDHAEAHCNLGLIRLAEGDYAGAVDLLRRGHELGTKQAGWRYPSAQWVAQAERTAAMAGRLPALLKGEERPKDTLDRLAVAQMLYDRQCHAAAARFWAEALEADPKLVDDRQAGHRYNAACASAMAGAGQGKDDPPPDEAAKAKLRQQARDWLRAELIAWTRLLESGPPQARPAIVQTLSHWRQDGDLAGIRDVEALAKLPPDEQKACRTLWADVDSLVKRAATSGARETKPGGAGKVRAPEAPARPKPSATR
jgi:eukaryotic-like serine/threonine-protein kinase